MSTKLAIRQLVESGFFSSNCASQLPLSNVAEVQHREVNMPKRDKSEYTDQRAREAEHIAAAFDIRVVPRMELKRCAWATVNNDEGGAKPPGGSVSYWPFRRPSGRRSPGERIVAEECVGAHGLRGNGRSRTQASGIKRSGVMT